ncbi:hypothetical protein [Alicyclobacillus dauci]|uniref:Uncharacterized protein n=1 Tax=Alicyclobacillus dauci TaxID=1475485 RepID=A0ABY6ZA05_9BACL|nr:hypothetical protein [Alicyclobacillus dauci]WAH39490.1 hypothetical protein NZD86_24285 [Alicyclobacillus dauci]WAH39550.1 hypothetical protein NZD86_23985 [Alicyclobacillus dauci]
MKSLLIVRNVINDIFPSKTDKTLWIANGFTWTAVLFMGGWIPMACAGAGTLMYSGTLELIYRAREEHSKLSGHS